MIQFIKNKEECLILANKILNEVARPLQWEAATLDIRLFAFPLFVKR